MPVPNESTAETYAWGSDFVVTVQMDVDAGDEYSIVNLDDGQAHEIDKRVRFCLVEISLGNAPDMSRVEN